VIRVENLGKRYRIGQREQQPESLGGLLRSLVTSPFSYIRTMTRPPTEAETLWALRNVSFAIGQGEVVGIIGPNGAGKSTLLKILTRITEPTEGRAIITGRVGSLLEVGTGFHPELTGRENVYLNGAVLGMTRQETARKFDEIVAFAGVEKFIDTPVKRYSSGMYVRLAFSVAAHLDPDILIVDEVLAVGDAGFRTRCLEKMRAIGEAGHTILFVSHEMKSVINLCQRTLVVENGQIAADGPTDVLVEQFYRKLMADSHHARPKLEFAEDPAKPAQITAIRLRNLRGELTTRFTVLEPITVELDFAVRADHPNLTAACQVRTQYDELLFITSDVDWINHTRSVELNTAPKKAGHYRARFTLPAPLLAKGDYELVLNLLYPRVEQYDVIRGIFIQLVDSSSFARVRNDTLLVPIPWQLEHAAVPAAEYQVMS
jgi:lipopolysaccharide transport system ATP-binding protein